MFKSLSFSQESLFAKVLLDKMPNKRKKTPKRSFIFLISPPWFGFCEYFQLSYLQIFVAKEVTMIAKGK